jgi:hypothetical protein
VSSAKTLQELGRRDGSAQRPPVFLMSAMSLLICSAYSSPSGSRQNFSPEVASAR